MFCIKKGYFGFLQNIKLVRWPAEAQTEHQNGEKKWLNLSMEVDARMAGLSIMAGDNNKVLLMQKSVFSLQEFTFVV